MQRTAFEGRVVFDVTSQTQTIRETIIQRGFARAIPEAERFTGEFDGLFVNLIAMMARTKAVIVDVNETDPLIVSLRSFWEFAHGNTNYRAVWEQFLDLPDIDINNEWMDAINAGAKETEYLKAPASVRPNTLSDEQLEGLGKEGQDFLAPAGST